MGTNDEMFEVLMQHAIGASVRDVQKLTEEEEVQLYSSKLMRSEKLASEERDLNGQHLWTDEICCCKFRAAVNALREDVEQAYLGMRESLVHRSEEEEAVAAGARQQAKARLRNSFSLPTRVIGDPGWLGSHLEKA